MNNNTNLKETQEEVLIYEVTGFPTLMYSESQFWINLTNIGQGLGAIERVFLLNCETRIFLNDPAAGKYARLDELLSISSLDTKAALIEQKNKFKAMMEGGKK